MNKTHVINGVTYVEVDRKAEVGEKIIIDDSMSTYYKNGDIFTVSSTDRWGNSEAISVKECVMGINHEEYRVLAECCETPDVADLLANLARRVNSLEQQLRNTQRNLETFAEQTESNSEDIRTLDERTQVINAINKFYEGRNS
jgi:hypothetical protein